ncbi:MAG: hypothetical protein JWQ42_1120, partial [Edaphobacter sp.]|nr:hypothetical protein [Edaphobacter sp.]
SGLVAMIRLDADSIMEGSIIPLLGIDERRGGNAEALQKGIRYPPNRAVAIAMEMTNPVEALLNLVYLIKHARHESSKVEYFANMADGQLRCLTEIVRRELRSTSLNRAN